MIRSFAAATLENIFAPNVPRAEVVTDITDGMKITLDPFGRGGRGGR